MNPFSRIPVFKRLDKVLPAFSGMIFFWAIFDGILIYISPLVFKSAGLSNSELGLVLGSSSLFGAAFDLLLSRIIRTPNYRRLYLAFFASCALVPLILWQAKTVPFFVFVMLLWGIYFDLLNFGNLDFVSRLEQEEKRTFYFGIITMFKAIGYIIAPILAGIAIAETINSNIFILMWVMLGIAFLFFIVMLFVSPRLAVEEDSIAEPKTLRGELSTWLKLGKIIWAPLIFTTLFCTYDAFFYTIGPLLAESYTNIQPYNGLIVTAYWIPAFLVSMYASRVANRFGKKRTAFLGLLFAAIPLCLFPLVNSPFVIMGLIFISGCASAFCIPAINSVYSDYISEAREYEEDIEGIGDFMTNMGFVLGPITAGLISDRLGYLGTFGFLGFFLIVAVLTLIKFTPRNIDIRRIYQK